MGIFCVVVLTESLCSCSLVTLLRSWAFLRLRASIRASHWATKHASNSTPFSWNTRWGRNHIRKVDIARHRCVYECISVSVCHCCTCMCCTIFLSCTRNSLASVARSDRTFSAWESCPWKHKDKRGEWDVRRYRNYI